MAERRTKSAAELGNQSWCRLADVVRQFEQAWQSGPNPELAEFLPPGGDPLRERVLVELIKVDQEYRWQAGQPHRIEAYLSEWPELRREAETMIDLVEAECLTRACHQAMPTREELGTRFPDLAPRIDLPAVAARAQQEQGSAHLGALAPVQVDTSREQQERTPGEGPVSLPATVGHRFGRYEIRQQLGRGGMGTVYRAYDMHLEREVALKIPQLDLTADEVVRERFLREARSAAAIRHRNVCPIYDAGQIDGTYYIAMALIEGRSLAAWMEDRTIDPRQAAELVAKLARALEAVHAAGVLHRDVKPSNVMIDASGEPLLMDFGLARQTEGRSRLTDSGSFLGTPAYMSPEQADGKPADARSDVYGLGLMLYQMLTGRLPFSGPPARLLHNIVHAPPPKPGRLRPDLDLRLEQICLKAMAKIPGTRHQTAGQLADALEEWLPSAGPPARRRWLASVAAAGAAAILLLGVMIYVKTNKGTLVLEIDPPDVNVTIDGNQVQIKSPRDEIRLSVGEHRLEVTKDGFETRTDSFVIRRGTKTEVAAHLVSASSRLPATSELRGGGAHGEGAREPREHPAVRIEMVTVGDPGNAACVMKDGTTRYGAVAYTYRIGKYEITVGQYCEFLNAVAKTDTYGLYDHRMDGLYGNNDWDRVDGLKQHGSPGNHAYSAPAEWLNRPIALINFWDACRFVNWLHNGQPTGLQDASTTEDGAYTLNGYTGSGGGTIRRNPGARYWLPNADEWYKAAYYKGGGTNAGYWKYPTQSDTLPSNQLMNPHPGNNANYAIPGGTWPPPQPPGTTIGAPYYVTEVGEFENSESAYGTFDQAGNVCEWFETLYPNGNRGLAGSAWNHSSKDMGNDWDNIPDQTHYPPYGYQPSQESGDFGFRVAGLESASSRPPGTPESRGHGTHGEGAKKPREHPAVRIEMVTVGDPGNAAETRVMPDGTRGYGAVAYTYRIGKYEITAGQYTEFLNAVAKTDTYALWDPMMYTWFDNCAIRRFGTSGSYSYVVDNNGDGMEDAAWVNRPVGYVTFWNAARFANWLHNGQPSGPQDASTTEEGAYPLNGYNATGGGTITRNPGARYWLPDADEWYKAAYYKGGGTNAGYWKYPTQSDTLPSNDLVKPDPGNNANYSIPGAIWPPESSDMTIGEPYYRTEVGEFENSESSYGTFDQAGNVYEWFETLYPNGRRGLAGGDWFDPPSTLSNDWSVVPEDPYLPPYAYTPLVRSSNVGFRVAGVPGDEKEEAGLLPPTPVKPRPSQSAPH